MWSNIEKGEFEGNGLALKTNIGIIHLLDKCKYLHVTITSTSQRMDK